MPVTLKSRIPEIQVELPLKVGAAIHKGTEDIGDAIRERAPVGTATPHLRDEVEVIETSPQTAAILLLFYWYFLEYGTVKMGAQPFVRPSIETTWPQFYLQIQEALKTL